MPDEITRYRDETKERDGVMRQLLEEETQDVLGVFSKEQEMAAREVSHDFSVKENASEVWAVVPHPSAA